VLPTSFALDVLFIGSWALFGRESFLPACFYVPSDSGWLFECAVPRCLSKLLWFALCFRGQIIGV